MPDEMTVEGQPRTLGIADPQVHFGDDRADWTGGLLAHSFDNFDGLTEHWYVRVGKRFDYEHAKSLPMGAPIEGGYVNADETLLEWVRHPANRVHKKAEEWQEYVKRFPAMLDKKTFLSIDEYGYGGGSLKSALAYGMVLNEMFRHTDFLKMAAYTMAVSTLDLNSTGAVTTQGEFCTSFTAIISGPCRLPFREIRRSLRRSIRLTAINRKQVRVAQPIRSTWWQH
jgi:alpha-N-arabinofuranosidase